MESIFFLAAGLALYLVVRRVARWAVRRQIARSERRQAEREQETIARYRAHTTPGRRQATPESAPTVPDHFRGATHMTDTDPAPAVPHVYSSPGLHGLCGAVSGAGASGGWEPSSCGGSDYSSSSSDSGSSCSPSSSSD